MAIRVLVKADFAHLVGDGLPRSDLLELENVLFGVVYPTLGYDAEIRGSSF